MSEENHPRATVTQRLSSSFDFGPNLAGLAGLHRVNASPPSDHEAPHPSGSESPVVSRKSNRFGLSRLSAFVRTGNSADRRDRIAKRKLNKTVYDIKQIRKHGEIGAVFHRHGNPDSISHDDEEILKLRGLCYKLVDYATTTGSPTECDASTEIISLSVSDPLIYSFLKEHYGSKVLHFMPSNPTYTDCERARLCLEDENAHVHQLWSRLVFLSQNPRENGDMFSTFLEFNHRALMQTLWLRNQSFLAARYLLHTLRLLLVGNDFFHFVRIWHCYMDVATEMPEIIEWINMNRCFEILPWGELRIAFVPPVRLARFIALLKPFWDRIPNVFNIFLSIPDMDFEALIGEQFDAQFDTHVSTFKDHFRLLPLYREALLDHVSDEERSELERFSWNTVLDERSMWPDYCDFAAKVLKRFSRGLLPPSVIEPVFDLKPELESPREDVRTTANYLAASLYQYCWPFELGHVYIPDIVHNHVRATIGIPSLPLFDNVPYLRRFQVGDKIYITSDGPPEPPSAVFEDAINNRLQKVSVDTMVLADSMVFWARIDRESVGIERVSKFAVSAGHDEDRGRLCVAAVKVEHTYHFTCVGAHESTATFVDESGVEKRSEAFLVLVQIPGYGRPQLNWVKFWPEKDVTYRAASDSAKRDDEHLEAFLGNEGEDIGHFYWS